MHSDEQIREAVLEIIREMYPPGDGVRDGVRYAIAVPSLSEFDRVQEILVRSFKFIWAGGGGSGRLVTPVFISSGRNRAWPLPHVNIFITGDFLTYLEEKYTQVEDLRGRWRLSLEDISRLENALEGRFCIEKDRRAGIVQEACAKANKIFIKRPAE